ncbi:H-NS family nucleoid-associated regulatory protein [Zoogloea sp.]|uniref:H-NS family nucleoid-associated regulatory protein n=1 Tax=Zoogloea sp. TaxID=49181 RepID=UPI001ACF7BD3|nr:H-NS family nucleoid-associated regulatory protein [Zoogloea sp.]MBN8285012.1 H-NS histone family protein [Zoogloea sp.]
MTDLKSYDLPELEALAEQIQAEINKREQEEADRACAAEEAAAEAERQVIAAAEAARRAAEEAAARKKAEAAARKEAQAQEAARKEAEASAAREAETKAKAAPPPEPAPAAPGHIRYMHPSNRALTWDGKGPTPDWVLAWMTTGGTLYALETTAEKLAPRPIPASFLKR